MKLRKTHYLSLIIVFATLYIIWFCWPSHSVSYEGDGFSIIYPENWRMAKFNNDDLEKTGAVLILAPEKTVDTKGQVEVNELDNFLFLTVAIRYIDYLPDEVQTYTDWHELQFKDTEYIVHSIKSEEINGREVTRVIYYKDEERCGRTISNAIYFNEYLSDPANNRMTIANLTLTSCSDKTLVSEGLDILESINVTKIDW